jgi:ankyrin repeat protein
MFFTVIHLLSNKFVPLPGCLKYMENPQSDLFRELDPVFAAVPVEYLENLIRMRLVSIRAAYESLFLLTGKFKQQSAFQLLLKIGFRYDWIAVPIWGHQLLYYAVSMDLDNALHLLLDKGCRPDLGGIFLPLSDRGFPTAICEALQRGNLGCMQLLLDCCDVNALIYSQPGRDRRMSNFDCFLVEFDDDDENLEYGLNAFIRAGADVNKPVVPLWSSSTQPLGIWYGELQREVPSCEGETRLSVLDYLFYFHRRVFHAISFKSNRTQPGVLSRACILLSLEGGIPNLQQYLDSLARRIGQQRLSKFLQFLIAEQFLSCDLAGRKRATDLKTVCALASCGVSIPEVMNRFPDILDRFIRFIGECSNEHDMDAIQYLLENGAPVDSSALSWLARLPERRLLDLALNHLGSSTVLHIALAEVASRNDFQAVEILLHAGVDLGVDTIDPDGWGSPMSLIARFIKSTLWDEVELSVMLDFLIKKGAVLRLSKRKPQLHHLLHFVLVQRGPHRGPRILATVQYITRAGYKDNLFLPSSLLEACGPATFEHLFRYGVQLKPGSPLVRWIETGGGIGLVREMLAAGASPNAYSRRIQSFRRTPLQAAAGMLRADIVELLLEEGADVNAAAKGPRGVTALQAVCQRKLEFTERNEEKLNIIQLLLARGADVNAAPARRLGHTALQAAAATGDLAVAKLLLLHNPMADVNAPPCQRREYKPRELGTALDIAAEYGRLDMVKLLLSCNALSHRRGENGYDGAIFLAEKRGHLAVADLIREHAKNDQRLHLRNPYLSEPPRHWSEYGYKLDLNEDSERSYETDSAESDNTDDESDSSAGIPYDADETEPPGAVQETHLVVYPDANQASEAVYNHGVQNSTQQLTHDVLPTAATLDNNTWADQGDLGLELEGNDVATLHPMYASHQMDFGTPMELDISLGSGIGQDVGVQYADRLDYELNTPERLIYEVDGDCE